MSPIVTIGLTTYNRPEMLEEAVNSVLGQTYKNFRLLIGNDNPNIKITFKNLNIRPDSRIEILNYKENIGEFNSMNYMLSLTKSEWFTWLADDDVLNKNFLNHLISALKKEDLCDISAVYCNYNSDSSVDSNFLSSDGGASKITKFKSKEFIINYISKNIRLQGVYGLLKTKELKQINGISRLGSGFGPYSDTIIPIVLSTKGDIVFVDQSLVFLRTHDSSLSASSSDFEVFSSAEKDFLDKFNSILDCFELGSYRNYCNYQMIRWFCYDEFMVLSRSLTLSRVEVVLRFLSYQFFTNLPRLKVEYWFKYLIYAFTIVYKAILSRLLKIIS